MQWGGRQEEAIEIGERTIGLGFDDLKKQDVVLLVSGEEKISVVRALSRSGLIDCFIVDGDTAVKMLGGGAEWGFVRGAVDLRSSLSGMCRQSQSADGGPAVQQAVDGRQAHAGCVGRLPDRRLGHAHVHMSPMNDTC